MSVDALTLDCALASGLAGASRVNDTLLPRLSHEVGEWCSLPTRAMRAKNRPVSPDYVERGLCSFRATLRARELKSSKVRDAVARCALQQSDNFCVQDLARSLQNEGVIEAHSVTIYRAMPLLIEAGLVRATLAAQSDSQCYAVVFERERRPQLQCSSCGRTVELPANALAEMRREVASCVGFELDSGASVLRGSCKSCKRVAKRSARAAS